MILARIVDNRIQDSSYRKHRPSIETQPCETQPERWSRSQGDESSGSFHQEKYQYRDLQAGTTFSCAPPSPPMDNNSNNLTLPSIQNLIGVADASISRRQRAGSEDERHSDYIQDHTQNYRDHQRSQGGSIRPRHLSPTPPLHSNPSKDITSRSPQSVSSSSSSTLSRPLGLASSSSESYQHQPLSSSLPNPARHPSHPPFPQPSHGRPEQAISGYDFAPMRQTPGGQGNYHLLQYPRPESPVMYHDHRGPSTAQWPANQQTERYICPTCNKAFSRPSSLRIHSHSHTGEKPFKCPHAGCGKAFSVRSNMKRHERGCHGSEGPGSM